MDLSRRSFIKWVIASGAAMACPVPIAALDAAKGAPAAGGPTPSLGGESNAVCHKVRDGEAIAEAPVDETCGVAIVGGGPSGLAAADELKTADFRLLEKEPHLGGNCWAESWEGCWYSTAAAWDSIADPSFAALAERWKFDWGRIQGEDTVGYDGVWIRDFWNGRADNPSFDKLPYGKSVKDGFRQFLKDLEKVSLEKDVKKLDEMTFADLLKGYPPQLKAFWDGFGPSNWGAPTELTSAYVGAYASKDWFQHPRYTWAGGIGMASRKVLDAIPESVKKKNLVTGASVYKVRRVGGKVRVSFFQDGKARTIEAKAAVMATPKFITKMLVEGLPADQFQAMSDMHYAPFMVYNLCFDRVVYNQGYDTYPVGAKNFTDFIPADWVTHAEGGDLTRKQVITVYAPRPEIERRDLLDDAKVKAMAQAAVAELCGMFPAWTDHLREVRIYRRGHPMPMSVPGNYTRLQPLGRRDLAPVYFGHCDAEGEVSDFFYAALSGIKAARKAATHL